MTSTFRHPEAFRLLRYRCETCGFVETVWNSRDGAAPLAIECAAAQCSDGSPACVFTDQWTLLTVHDIAARKPGLVEASGLVACGKFSVHAHHWLEGCICTIATDCEMPDGARYFRDGIPAEARAIAKARIKAYRASEEATIFRGGFRLPPMTDEWEADLIRRASEGTPSPGDLASRPAEFAPGWPMLVVRGTDADGLPPRKAER